MSRREKKCAPSEATFPICFRILGSRPEKMTTVFRDCATIRLIELVVARLVGCGLPPAKCGSSGAYAVRQTVFGSLLAGCTSGGCCVRRAAAPGADFDWGCPHPAPRHAADSERGGD